jgi:hypothetical protein
MLNKDCNKCERTSCVSGCKTHYDLCVEKDAQIASLRDRIKRIEGCKYATYPDCGCK